MATSGKTVGSNKKGHITPIAPSRVWSANKDTTYKQQNSAAVKALKDYVSGQATSQNQYNIEYNRNNKNLLDQQKIANVNQADDYASRGMSTSGLRVKAQGVQDNEYGKQRDVLRQASLNFGTTARSQLGNFKSTQAINDTRYKNEAINRHASSFGLI